MTDTIFIMLIMAIQAVETPNGEVYGDRGKSVGPLQISRQVVTDVNRAGGNFLFPDDCYCLDRSTEIAQRYFSLYNATNPFDAAALWNGGPTGLQKESAREYAERVTNLVLSYAQ